MMSKKENKMHLASLDEIFKSQEERDIKEKVKEIKIDEIDDFPNHPFKVIENEELYNMRDSIIENGVLVPTLVRPKENGRYELISGHRRKRASELANMQTLPCIVRDLTDDEAIIIMVDSNLQREEILPSEKAFAYKMKIDALNRQGKRNDLTFSQLGKKLNSYEELAEETGESRNTIHRYIRLTNLLPELLTMVDEKQIGLSPAVEISYLTKEEQKWLLEAIDYNCATPSHAQSIDLKELSQSGDLTKEIVMKALAEYKPNQEPKLKLSEKRIRSVLPQDFKMENFEDFVIDAIRHYSKYLKTKEQSRGER